MSDETIPEGFIDISEANDQGVLKKIIREGQGEHLPIKNDEVYVHYVGTLYGGDKDGEKFDSSRDRNEHFSFKLGTGQVIKAWDQGVATMKRGELCELICKPKYAYGESGSPPKIPPNTTLKFEVELFRWSGEDLTTNKDGGVIRSVLMEGSGWENADKGSKVKINFSVRLSNSDKNKILLEKENFEFEIGSTEYNGLCEGVAIALMKMKKKEKSRLIISPKYAFGSVGHKNLKVPENAELEYTVELVDFDKLKDSYQLRTDEEKISESESLKVRGNDYFKKNQLDMAKIFYEKIKSHLSNEKMDKEPDLKEQRDTLMVTAHLNLALCHLKSGSPVECCCECDEVLSIDPNCEKALFRKAQAQMELLNYEESVSLFKKVLEINPSNSAATNSIGLCLQKQKKDLEKEKNLCKNMFSKMASSNATAAVN